VPPVPEAPTVRLVTTAEIPRAAAALGAAFHDDPVMHWLFPRDPGNRRKAGLFALQMKRYNVPRQAAYTTDDLAGAAMWSPPGTWRVGPVDIVRDLPTILRLIGTRFVVAMRGLALVEKRHPTAPHWYLGALGTEPAKQGRGIGGALMAPVLDVCDRRGLPAYLESSKERNLAFYRRYGFEVTDTVSLPDGPPIWLMWREPRTAGS